MKRAAYSHYGEGSIHHPPERPCDCFGPPSRRRPLRHPLIMRYDFASRWHFYAWSVSLWLSHRQFRRIRIIDDRLYMPPLRFGLGRFVRYFDPFRRPDASAPLMNADSIYERS